MKWTPSQPGPHKSLLFLQSLQQVVIAILVSLLCFLLFYFFSWSFTILALPIRLYVVIVAICHRNVTYCTDWVLLNDLDMPIELWHFDVQISVSRMLKIKMQGQLFFLFLCILLSPIKRNCKEKTVTPVVLTLHIQHFICKFPFATWKLGKDA